MAATTPTKEPNPDSSSSHGETPQATQSGAQSDSQRNGDKKAAENGRAPVHASSLPVLPKISGDSLAKAKPLPAIIAKHSFQPLLWALPTTDEFASPRDLIPQLSKASGGAKQHREHLPALYEVWSTSASQREVDAPLAIECLAWCWTLSDLTKVNLTAAQQCVDTLLEMAARAEQQEDVDLLAREILTGELPYVLGVILRKSSAGATLMKWGKRRLSHGIEELTDGEGLVHADHLPFFRSLIASWTRCAALARKADSKCFDRRGREQYEWAVRQILRISRADGSQMFSTQTAVPGDRVLMLKAIELGGNEGDFAIAARLWPKTKKTIGRTSANDLPETGIHSEWAEAAVLRTAWASNATTMAIAYNARSMRTELNIGGETFWSGATNPEIKVDGNLLTSTSEWSEICWFSDKDVEYIELEISFGEQWQLQRQILLARDDNFLLLADAVLGKSPARIDYALDLPLQPHIKVRPAAETHEAILSGKKKTAVMLPLALPEWRGEQPIGSITPQGDRVQFQQSADARRLYAPLFVYLPGRKLDRPLTWRRLTVAENRTICAPEEAVGYRVQVGLSQWLFYRSLTPATNRTVLGQNLSTEFLASRFDGEGEADQLIEIE